MLRARAVAVTVEPDRKGAPEVSLTGRISRCRADMPSHCGRLRPETGLLALFGGRFQERTFLESPPSSRRSGECWLDNDAALARPARPPYQDLRPDTRSGDQGRQAQPACAISQLRNDPGGVE